MLSSKKINEKVDSYVINDGFALKIAKKKTAKPPAVTFPTFLFFLGITHAMFHNKIRILSAICALRWLHKPTPPPCDVLRIYI